MLPLDYPHTSLNAPRFCCVVDGVTWACSTDGHSLAARIVDDSDWPIDSDARRATVIEALAATTLPLDLPALRAFLGEPQEPRMVNCEECRGTGRHREADGDCECERCICDYCDGEKWAVELPNARYVRILGRPYNADVVGRALKYAGAEGASTWGELPVRGHGLVVRGDGWLTIAMGTHEPTEPIVPSFGGAS